MIHLSYRKRVICMANLNEMLKQFDNLTIDELDSLKTTFFNFYYQKEYDIFFKKEIELEKSKLIVCPTCGSTHVVKCGKDQFGDQRYACKNEECKRKTFTLKADTLTYYSKRSKKNWLTFFECLFNKDSLKLTALKCSICKRTALAWRHKSMYLIYKMLTHVAFQGLTVIDETFVNIANQGLLGLGQKKRPSKRGISKNKVGIACGIDEKGNILLKVINDGRPTSKSLVNVFNGYLDSSNTVVSDSLRSYHKLHETLQYEWIKIPSGKKSYNGYTLDEVNDLHGNIKMFLSQYRGINKTFLPGYLALFELLRRNGDYYQDSKFREIVKNILVTPLKHRGDYFTTQLVNFDN